jgi:hypothetical protein
MAWRGPAGEARHTGVTIGVWEREGKALGVPQEGSPQRSTEETAPLHGARQTDALRAGQVDTRNNRDFGDALIRAVFDEVSVGI